MDSEFFDGGDNVYAYPNQHLPYFRDVADIFEEDGLNYDDSEVLFVGGTMYAHDFKADYPEAEVDVIEKNPLTAYLQTFISHQFDQGNNKEEVRSQIFHYDHWNWSIWKELDRMNVKEEDLNENVQKHHKFADSKWWNHHYGFPENILYTSEFEPEEIEFSLKDKIEDLVGLKDLKMMSRSHELDEITKHEEKHENEVIWAHYREQIGGEDSLSLKQANIDSNNFYNVLDDVNTFAPVDAIRIEDAKNVEANYDLIFFNNVFDYIDNQNITEAVDSLTAEDGAYMETTLLGRREPEDGKIPFDNMMPGEIDLMEHGPKVNFYWKHSAEKQKEVKESNNKVRLYKPVI